MKSQLLIKNWELFSFFFFLIIACSICPAKTSTHLTWWGDNFHAFCITLAVQLPENMNNSGWLPRAVSTFLIQDDAQVMYHSWLHLRRNCYKAFRRNKTSSCLAQLWTWKSKPYISKRLQPGALLTCLGVLCVTAWNYSCRGSAGKCIPISFVPGHVLWEEHLQYWTGKMDVVF